MFAAIILLKLKGVKKINLKELKLPDTMDNNIELEKISDEFLMHCHLIVNRIKEEMPNSTHQDGTNVWIFGKMAEFELRIRKLENTNR